MTNLVLFDNYFDSKTLISSNTSVLIANTLNYLDVIAQPMFINSNVLVMNQTYPNITLKSLMGSNINITSDNSTVYIEPLISFVNSNVLVMNQTYPNITFKDIIGSNITITANNSTVYFGGLTVDGTLILSTGNVGSAVNGGPVYTVSVGNGGNNIGTRSIIITEKATSTGRTDSVIIGGGSPADTGTQPRNVIVGTHPAGFGTVGHSNTTFGHLNSTNLGDRNVSIGTFSCGTNSSGANSNDFVAVGYSSGGGGIGSVSNFVGIGSGSHGFGTQKNGSISIGFNAASGTANSNFGINLGFGCQGDITPGRLCFGSNMELPHGNFPVPTAIPQHYLKIKWNGVLYYLPMYTSIPT